MAKLSFLWHLHQPSYRTADGVSHAPWTLVHAGGAYRTLAAAISETGGRGQVINIVPTLLEQLLAYRDGTVRDPVVDALSAPAGELSDAERETLVSWAFHVTPRQLKRYRRLAELARRRRLSGGGNRLATAFGPGDLRDLQVLFILAQAGEQAWTDPRLRRLARRGRGFSPAEHESVIEWLLAQPGELIGLWRDLARQAGVEISTSPYAHPIMPLLADTGVVVDSWAPHPAPEVPTFRYPEDAAWQLETGLSLMKNQGLAAAGCWPPEGSVSTEVLSIYADAGVRWLVTDEGILERSLGRAIRDNDSPKSELYRPWTLSTPSPVLFFRDRSLSDAIGFRYGRWDDEARAAHALVVELEAVAQRLPDDATIVLALDGENPWLHYPEGGGTFLRTLMEALAATGDHLRLETLTEMAAETTPSTLDSLHPGSWINGVFATWIGHPEKTSAWRLLAEVRHAIERTGKDRPPSLLVAEASDWFWWLGDDNPTELAPLYDRIFRRHLADACRQVGLEPPVDLEQPLKTLTLEVSVPVSSTWHPPTLDGRRTSYFEWCLATSIATEDTVIDRVSVWGGPDRLHLFVGGDRPMVDTIRTDPLEIRLEDEYGNAVSAVIDTEEYVGAGVAFAVDQAAEVSLEWNSQRPARLELRRGDRNILGDSVLLLEPMTVDEFARPKG
jgi:alpha-amylase/alpha-mannosidase (GH57 family)